MKKKLLVLLCVIIMFVIGSGCSSNSSSTGSNKNVKILFSVSNASDNFRNKLASAAKKYADSNNVDLTVKDAAGSIETQVSHMKEAVSGGYSAIICIAVNPDTALQLKKAANGLPIVFINSCPDASALEKDKYIYVGSNEATAGEYQAKYIIDSLSSKKSINVVLFKGEKNHLGAIERTNAVKETFKKNGITAEYVFEDYANWSRQTAKNFFNIFLSTHKNFDCVICNNDEMALGVIDACIENKIDPSSVPILGIDATSDACKAVSDGTMKFTVYQSAKGQSESAVKAAVALSSGSSLTNIGNLTSDGKYIYVPFEKVNKNNVTNYTN